MPFWPVKKAGNIKLNLDFSYSMMVPGILNSIDTRPVYLVY